jgi:nitrogen PTS system EIIA component
MNHPSDTDLLLALLDGELSADAADALEARLKTEPDLADAFLTLAREEVLLSQWARALTEVQTMSMSDFVVRDAIVPDLKATTKEGVVRELVESLGHAGYFPGGAVGEIIQATLKRELLGSTGIGRSVAIPHTKHAAADRILGTVGISQRGVPFDSLDGGPVHVFVLLVSPLNRPGDHLRTLEKVSRVLRDDGFVRALRQAATGDAIWGLLGHPDYRP